MTELKLKGRLISGCPPSAQRFAFLICHSLNHCFNLQDESECTSDEEIFISQDEIQSFMANNQSFYSNREQYRQHLKEKFNKYCRLNDHKRPICSGWLTTAGAN